MGSSHGPLDAWQLLERGRLWADAARGPGVASGALYQRRTTLVEVAPAGVPHGRLEEGRQPNAIDAQRLHIVELGGHALEIADAVPIRVHERARIDLVEHRAPPPVI
jgi:hypothetical protein